MIFDKPIKHNPVSEAKAREMKRSAEKETEELNKQQKVFYFKAFGFRPQYRAMNGSLYLEGPLCPRKDAKDQPCLAALAGESEKTDVTCEVCGFTATLPSTYERFRQIAHKKYEGHLRYIESGGEIQTLDVPYEAIKARDEDETRAIEIKWSQKDGRNMAVIYFIDKNNSIDKAQIFVDIDREELRYDATNTPPDRILAVVKAEFRSTLVNISYKDNNNNKTTDDE